MNELIESYSLDGLASLVDELHLPSYRARQIASWLYARDAASYDDMSDLPKSLRATLAEAHPLIRPKVIDLQKSNDGTEKFVLLLHDKNLIETVSLPAEDGRLTVCCSSQSGCGMGCSFCATGQGGLHRNLTPGEIVEQICLINSVNNQRVTNVVFMGQGEPFANYQNTVAALRILNHPKLLGIGARKITVSTCGIIPGILKFSHEPEQFTLAVSLHSAIQHTRDMIMPGVTKYPLHQLKEALVTYLDRTDRRITFEYALMQGINDSNRELDALIGYCEDLLCHVNLIPLNHIPGSPYKPVKNNVMKHWENALLSNGINATIRHSRGSDIAGACGQLANSVRQHYR